MKNKKVLIIAIIFIIICVIGIGTYTVLTSYLFNEDGTIASDGHVDLINHLKSIEDKDERKNAIDFSVENNLISQEEANEIYNY